MKSSQEVRLVGLVLIPGIRQVLEGSERIFFRVMNWMQREGRGTGDGEV